MFNARLGFGACLVAFVIYTYVNYGYLLTLENIKTHRSELDAYVSANPYFSGLLYMTTMSVVIGTNMPGATALSLTGGFLFPQPWACLYAYVGYVVGASGSYCLVRFVIGDSIRKQMSENSAMFRKFEDGMKDADNFWQTIAFLVFVRYIAFFPFWFVNSACALLSVGYPYFLLTTAMAVVPGSVLYTMSGRIIGKTLDQIDGEISSWDVLKGALLAGDREMLIVCGVLMVCTLAPFVLKLVHKFTKTTKASDKKTEEPSPNEDSLDGKQTETDGWDDEDPDWITEERWARSPRNLLRRSRVDDGQQ